MKAYNPSALALEMQLLQEIDSEKTIQLSSQTNPMVRQQLNV